MWLLIIGLIIFLGIHSVRMLAPAFRQQIVDNRGPNFWRGLYTLVSLIGIALLIWGFGEARFDNAYLYTPPLWLNHLQSLLMLFAMILLVASQLPAGKIKATLKNPMLIAVKIWAIGHLLVNGDLASILLFGCFLVWAVLLVINTKRRGDPVPQFTSVRNDIISVVAGAAIWAVFAFWLHEWLIGVPVIA